MGGADWPLLLGAQRACVGTSAWMGRLWEDCVPRGASSHGWCPYRKRDIWLEMGTYKEKNVGVRERVMQPQARGPREVPAAPTPFPLLACGAGRSRKGPPPQLYLTPLPPDLVCTRSLLF